MTFTRTRFADKAVAVVLTLVLLCAPLPSQQQSDYLFRAQSDLVLVNVTVRDKSGKFVQGLKPENFTILEDNKPQKVVSFDVENVDAVPAVGCGPGKAAAGAGGWADEAGASAADAALQFKDRRLIVLFFDLSAMEPDEIDHAVTSAEHYVDAQMAPADLVSIVSLGSSLLVNQDFTADHALLKKQLQAFSSGSGQGFRRRHYGHDRRDA